MSTTKSYLFPLFIIGVLFFVFGFITWVNGVLIPYFQICLELTNFQSLFVAFAAYVAYFFMAIPSAYVLQHTGYKKGMVIGLVIMAIGTITFIPAAYARTYSLFLGGLFVTGIGLALLQTAANPYVAIIGPAESTAQRIGFMGIANKTAGILSQRILGAIFLLNSDAIVAQVSKATPAERAAILDEYVLKVVNPYIVITVILLLLAVMIYFSRLPEVEEQSDAEIVQEGTEKKSILQFPHLVLGVIALFMAGGCEVIPIDAIIVYSRSIGIPMEEARHYAEYTLYAMLVGYITSTICIPRFISQQNALAVCAVIGLILTVSSYYSEGFQSVLFLMLMGFGAAMLWGTIWGLALQNLGSYTKMGSALLLMSVIGGGIFPVLFGGLIDHNPEWPQTSVLLLGPCYAYLLYYALRGHKIKWWRKEEHTRVSSSTVEV